MPIHRLTAGAALVFVLLAATPLQAKTQVHPKNHAAAKTQVTAKNHPTAKSHSTAKSKATSQAHTKSKHHPAGKTHAAAPIQTTANIQSAAPAASIRGTDASPFSAFSTSFASVPLLRAHAAGNVAALLPPASATAAFNPTSFNLSAGKGTIIVPIGADADQSPDNDGLAAVAGSGENVTDLRKALIAMAMDLRDTRYVRGGRDPSTGFDCSGFVRYVFAHAIGMKLPTNSASQFLAGLQVKRADMKPGDLVFFHTGRKQRISHVGIYISNGRFIHSPATGKSVQVSSLDESYWAKHFAGAKRPQAMAMAAHNG